MEAALRRLISRVQSGQWPLLPCPNCTGSLALTQVQEIESRDSRVNRDHEGWEPEWIRGRFVAVPECQGCGEAVVVTGRYRVDMALTSDGRWYGDYDTFYEVEATSPGLRMVDVPERAPEIIRVLAQEAAAVLWTSPPASASALRRAVEAMLDDLRVNKTGLTKQNKRERLKTHRRIELLSQSRPEVADGLMAVKWVGNEGSHEAKALRVEQVLDIADVFAYALRLVYDNRDQEIKRRIAKINRKRGSVN